MYRPEDSLRAALAEQAARQILHGRSPAALYPRLRRRTTAELLAGARFPSTRGPFIALPAALDALLCAVQLAVRRRSGWLRVEGLREVPTGLVLGVRAALLQAAMLCFLRDCLLCGATASVHCRAAQGALLLRLHGERCGCSGETAALLQALAQAGGGAALFNAVSGAAVGFTAVLRLSVPPAPPDAPISTPTAEDLLCDRFSPLYLYLHGLCADPWE